jgi:hypothetical protein
MARREALVELGGFDEALYPNEENALMDELQRRGGKLIYDPEIIVHRRPRATLKSFARMLRTYGRGRAEQFRLHPTWGSMLNFVPPIFCLYLVLLPLAWWFIGVWSLVLLLAYGLAVLGQILFLLAGGGSLVRCLCAGPLILLTHVLYGCGFWHGLFTKLRPAGYRSRPSLPVILETVSG